MPTDTPPSSNRVRKDISTMCRQHKGKQVELYCKSHDTLLCSLCFADDHRSCRDIDNIAEVSLSVFDSQEYKEFKQNLTLLGQQAWDIITKSCDKLAKSDQSLSETIDSIQRFRVEIDSLLAEIETSLLAQVEKNKADIKAKGEHISGICSSLYESIDQLTAEFESMESANRICQAYIRMKETIKDVQDNEHQLRQVRENNSFELFTFVPNENLRKLLTGPEGLGLLSIQRDTSPLIQTASSRPYKQDRIQVTQAVNSASFVQDINVKSAHDTEPCLITDSVVVSKSKLVVVDHANCKVKLLDTKSMHIISVLQVPLRPWDITIIKEDQIAITVRNYYINDKGTLIILNVTDNRIAKGREMRVNGLCESIAYCRNQLIVSYIGYPPKLEIMDLQGHVTRKIERDRDGNTLFKYPACVRVSSDGDTICVSDYDAHSVISLSRDGAVKAIYKDSNLKFPRKVCIDHRDKIFVGGQDSKNIYMLTLECTKIKELLTETDGLTDWVYSVSHCRYTDNLYVGMWECDKVKVYQLSNTT